MALMGDETRRAFFHDSRFFKGDFLDCVAKKFDMIKADRGDKRRQRTFDDVCAIQPSAHAGFDQAEIGFMRGKKMKHERACKFEKRHRRVLVDGVYMIDGGEQCVIFDQRAES